MSSIKSKLFGDNKLNFYGWIFTGVLILVVSLSSLIMGAKLDSIALLLISIYLVLAGMFCLQLQNYHSRVSEKLEKNETVDKK